jgi:hypothetical protein
MTACTADPRLIRRQAELRRQIVDALAALRRLHDLVEVHPPSSPR